MQLHDFSELQAFPAKLRYLCICLSEVIFMEGFMRKIYNFINGLEVLHLVGTYEKIEQEEEEIYVRRIFFMISNNFELNFRKSSTCTS